MEMYQFLVVVIMGLISSAVFTAIEIPILRKKQFGQYIREEGPESHLSKQGTPTMGGVAIYASIILTSFVCSNIFPGNPLSMVVIVVTGLFFGGIGFLDDFIKVAAKHNLGLRAWQKLVLQIVIGAGFAYYIMKYTESGSFVWVPFINRMVDFGRLFIPFVVFVMVAMANSVNLTDGLDGLCSGVTAIVAVLFAFITQMFDSVSSSVYCLAITGACVGFLLFNRHPAKIFMGDTGSMALGAGLTAAIIMSGAELLIPFAGFIFVMESASVIIQVISFKSTGKRVFRMSPIHHHFELGGMKETSVVRMFWVLTLLFCIATLIILKISIR